MDRKEIQDRLNMLPRGGLTTRKIKGPNDKIYEYTYLQWVEDGKQKSRILKKNEVELVKQQLQEREYLELQLVSLSYASTDFFEANSTILTGESLKRFVLPAKNYKKRKIYEKINSYIYGDIDPRVLIMYGLRRTGKTTLIKQIILNMNEKDFNKTAFIQITNKNTLAELNRDIRTLQQNGYKFVFVDEVTLLEDFIEGSALLPDIYAASGIKIVLSGTDSLSFWFAKSNQLYDRCVFVRTTFIPYREFEEVLGKHGIDNYIEYGGTMSIGGIYYNNPSISQKDGIDEYVDSAIAENIQHSLKFYQYGGHFRKLYDLYKKNELTSAINRVVEDMNHNFALDVLERKFKSNDLQISANNLRNDKNNDLSILDDMDVLDFTNRLKEYLNIKNKEEQSIQLEEVHIFEIKEYLEALDLLRDVEIRDVNFAGQTDNRIIFVQPGIRYSQAKLFIESLKKDKLFDEMTLENQTYVISRILNEIKGRMMEDIVLLETKLAKPNCEIFKLLFVNGEFDMVVKNSDEGTIEIYEIKHSDKIVSDQAKHLRDEKKCSLAQYRYGNIIKKCVLYRGENTIVDGIEYINVEKYLKSL